MTLHECLQKFLLKDIIIFKGKKKIKAGKVLLYTVRDHYVYFTLLYNDSNKKFELPRPFRFEEGKNCIILDYTIDELGSHHEKKIESLRDITKTYFSSSNRYFDSMLTLSATN